MKGHFSAAKISDRLELICFFLQFNDFDKDKKDAIFTDFH
ncbi:hypothetical protein J2X31_001769 [Flavobacterium arsenatis]|uniref:Transposase n=1 Tax=Flavobacterium arsenatis TaxID=1484332 RepID=A0ABU1TP67_9FLAO|nr:hypothetical protein [Flavobacterium arsenatis]